MNQTMDPPATVDESARVAHMDRVIAERNELQRQACLRGIARAKAGQAVDERWLEWARDFVAMTPKLEGPMGTGEPYET